jgi:hypothetical protein
VGQELHCTARFGKQVSAGKALLETSGILFRGDFRLKIPFSGIKSIKAVDGELRVQTADGLAAFELGKAAEKWCEKILHPKTRIEKLGVKAGAKVSVVGKFDFDEEFVAELKALKSAAGKEKADDGGEWIFLAVSVRDELGQVAKIAKVMNGAASLWIVHPKGLKIITESDVLAAGRKAGLKDVKVCGFSATHTALKFVVPVAKR